MTYTYRKKSLGQPEHMKTYFSCLLKRNHSFPGLKEGRFQIKEPFAWVGGIYWFKAVYSGNVGDRPMDDYMHNVHLLSARN
jgi:hypothetical protein